MRIRWSSLLVVTLLSGLVALGDSGPAAAEESQWLHGPPGGISVTRCPDPGQWLLLYWGGVDEPVAKTAGSCATSDRFWMRRATTWLGYYPEAPRASDDWIVRTGEAAFVHGTAPEGGANPSVAAIPPDGPSISAVVNAEVGPAIVPTSSAQSFVGSSSRPAPTSTPPAATSISVPTTTPATATPTATAASVQTVPSGGAGQGASPVLPSPTGPTTVPVSSGSYAVTQNAEYRTPLGTLHVVGQVRNNGESAIEQIQIRAIAFDAGNAMLASEEATACLGIVPAGGDTPFDIPFFQAPNGVARWVLDVRARPATREPPSGLDASNVISNKDDAGVYRLSGEVKNNSRQTYRFVQVCAGFYDSGGTLVRVDSTFTNPPTLAPRDIGSFEVSHSGVNIDSFRVWTIGLP